MDAVTYPHETVIEYLSQNLIPLRIAADAPMAMDFAVSWTPALLILDANGKEHHRTIGFLAPEELIPSLSLGIGKMHYDANDFPAAISLFEDVLAHYSKSEAAPEAVFLAGVSRYKNTHMAQPLKEAYEQLLKEYPQSAWTKRAYPYRLL